MRPQQIKTNHIQRWFYALALFNLASISLTLWVTGRIMGNFAAAIAQNREWATRLSRYAELNNAAALANAPGNDVFDSKDVAAESAKLDAILAAYQGHRERARRELSALPERGDALRLLAELAAIDSGMDEMVGEARSIFASLRQGQPDQAGARMASMDRSFARMRESGQRLEQLVRAIQMRQLGQQQLVASALHRYQVAVSALLLLVVLAVVLFGRAAGQALQRGVRAVAEAELRGRELLQRIEARNRDLRLILDHVGQGLLTVSATGVLSAERSAIVDRWLGPHREGLTFWEYVRPMCGRFATLFEMGFDALQQDLLPRELLLEQMPRRLRCGGYHLQFEYHAIIERERERDDAPVSHLMMVVTDVTRQVEQERAEAEQRALLALVQRLLSNREAFCDFYQELAQLVQRVLDATDGGAELRRAIHTIKGSCAGFGVAHLAALCHDIETRMAEEPGGLSPSEREQLRGLWQGLDRHISKLFCGERTEGIVISQAELERLLERIWDGASRQTLALEVERLRLQPLEPRLLRLAEQTRDLAARFQKGPLEVTVDAGGVRVPGECWSRFFSACTHLVRNAVDHALDSGEERAARRKPAAAHIHYLARTEGSWLVLEFCDDGRGIPRDRVAEKARAMGLPVGDVADDRVLLELLCQDGLSTREEVSEVSGRGVGLAAVRAECQALGGAMSLRSIVGYGTRFTFRFPLVNQAGSSGSSPGMEAA